MRTTMPIRFYFLALLVMALLICPASSDIARALQLKSEAFADSGYMPDRYSARGENLSPPLSWSDVPAGTESLVLIMDDPDAPLGTWVHWVIYGIPGASTGLDEGIPRIPVLDDGTRQGINSFRWIGYGGPMPPPGEDHRYSFRLYAVDSDVALPPGANKGQVMRSLQGHILVEDELIARYAG